MKYTITLASLGLLTLTVATSATAGRHHNDRYNHCADRASQSAECQSSLGENTYDLLSKGIASGTTPHSGNAVNVDGVNVAVSTWADTTGGWDRVDGTWVRNNKVTRAGEPSRWSGGYGVDNSQDGTYWHDHAIDNYETDYYGFDSTDYDFVLFSFDTDVTLTGASFGWADSKYNNQVSVAGLSDISALTSGNNSWKGIVEQSLTAGSFDITYCDPGYKSTFDFSSSAQYWLVGAYNTVFGDIGGTLHDDAFKLASVGFRPGNPDTPSPNTEVSEPATLGLLLAGGLFAGWRKKRIDKKPLSEA